MPLLATLIGSLFTGLTSVFGLFLAARVAARAAVYTITLAVLTVYITGAYSCLSILRGFLSSMFNSSGPSTFTGAFGMGLGMLIPSNSLVVISCVSSIWVLSQVYKLQRRLLALPPPV